jgi:hypothetical protein
LDAQDAVRIIGTVVDQTGAVIPDAEVALKRAGHDDVQRQRTDGIGQFRFPGLSPGFYTVEVSAQGFNRRVIGISASGTITRIPPTALDVAPTGACPAGSFARPSTRYEKHAPGDPGTPVITGEVVKAAASEMGVVSTMPGVAVVLLTRDHDRVVAETRTDGRGSFEFHGVPVGSYKLRASLMGYADFVMDNLDVRPDEITRIEPWLEMEQCPAPLHCTPNERVHVVAICL